MTGELTAALDRGRKAHPGLEVDEGAFRRFLDRAMEGRAEGVIDGLAVEDLFLACACAERVSGAAEAFEARFVAIIWRSVARVFSQEVERDEAVQRVREHLLVGGPSQAPKIAKYRGMGPLESWVAVAAIRFAVSMGRAASAERRLSVVAADEIAGTDPESLLMESQIRRELESAVAESLARLDGRDRLVLRLYLVSGMTLTSIGQTLGVSQQAVSRQLAKARERVLDDVCQSLATRLKFRKAELASLVRIVRSRLDVSVSRLLASG